MLAVGSLFSGCGGFDLGFHRAGFRTLWACEIDPKARAVFQRHFPDAEIHHDVTKLDGRSLAPVDVLIFGSPCQDLSVAGKRAGLAGERSGLFSEAMRIVDEMAAPPRVAVWENVPGALSSNGGDDFATVLSEMGQRWSGVAYRVLDLQYFGPPQRRRRVFAVGHSGGWASAAEVLFEREGVRWNPPTRRKAGKTAPPIPARRTAGGGLGTDSDCDGGLIAHALRGEGFDASEDGTGRGTPLVPVAFGGNNCSGPIDVAPACNAHGGPQGRQDFESEASVVCSLELANQGTGGNVGFHPPEIAFRTLGTGGPPGIAFNLRSRDSGAVVHGTQDPCSSADTAFALGGNNGGENAVLCFDTTQVTSPGNRSHPRPGDPCHPLTAGGHPPAVASNLRGREGGAMPEPAEAVSLRAASGGSSRSYVAASAVRRLTPRECERLMGWPDDYTAGFADGPRYKMIGNGVGAPVAEWIARRIAASLAAPALETPLTAWAARAEG